MGAVRLDQEDDALLIRVGALVLATGFTGVSRSGLWAGRDGRRPAVLSGLEAEVLLNSGGPTGGRLLLPDGRPPERVGILADWAGNGQSPSALPCNPLLGAYLKLARQIKEQLPQAQLTFFYRELSLPDAAAARFFRELSSVKGLSLIRLDREEPPALGDFDLLVAAEEFAGTPGSADLAARLRLSLDEAGFWKTLGQQLHPVNTAADGVYAVGCSRGPRDIQSAILDGQAAAGQILSRLIPGEQVALEPLTAWVEQEHCSGCRLCLERCPALALEWDPEAGTARINEFLCRGCGICAALCPGGAVHARHYENNQVAVEIRGLLHVENT
jgi:heterodisulfide reductase subunit A